MEHSLRDFCVFICESQNKLDGSNLDFHTKFMFAQLHHAILNAAASFIRARGADEAETLNFLIECRRSAERKQ